MLDTLKKREKTILLAAAIIAVFGFCFKTILNPVLTRNETLNKKIGLARSKLRKDLMLLSQKEHLREAYAKILSDADMQQETEDAPVNIFSEIEGLGRRSGVRIIDIRPQAQNNLSPYKENYMELRIEGDMESCLKFIYNIENSLGLFQVRKFRLNARPASANLEGSFLISQVSL
ncbi:MAG: hypothetical protein V1869_06375 [Candidatus Omnitrophota bacterium]